MASSPEIWWKSIASYTIARRRRRRSFFFSLVGKRRCLTGWKCEKKKTRGERSTSDWIEIKSHKSPQWRRRFRPYCVRRRFPFASRLGQWFPSITRRRPEIHYFFVLTYLHCSDSYLPIPCAPENERASRLCWQQGEDANNVSTHQISFSWPLHARPVRATQMDSSRFCYSHSISVTFTIAHTTLTTVTCPRFRARDFVVVTSGPTKVLPEKLILTGVFFFSSHNSKLVKYIWNDIYFLMRRIIS